MTPRQRHARAIELAMDRQPVRPGRDQTAGAAGQMEQQRLQLGVRQLRRKQPNQPGKLDPLEIVAGGALPALGHGILP